MNKHLLSTLALSMMACLGWAQYPTPAANMPLQIVNNSVFKDNEIYVGILGMYKNGGNSNDSKWIYYDLTANKADDAALKDLNESVNTLHKQAGDQGYANIFTTLDKVKDKTIYIDHTAGCRLLIGFRSPLYLHAFATGYAGASLDNPSDPNANIRWENLEFTYDWYNVIFANTTRVDCFQYPMGVEVYGTSTSNNAYMKAGELVNYKTMMDEYKKEFGNSTFASCIKTGITADRLGGIIVNPSKVASIRDSYFTDEINKVWNYFTTHTLNVSFSEFGTWTGKVESDGYLTMTSPTKGTVRIAKPSSKEIIECSGTMAHGSQNELQFEAQICGAMNRGAIDLTEDEQKWQDKSKFFRDGTVYNPYVKFFHQTDLTYNGYTYAFAYDDTGDNSATVATKDPKKLVVTIGGFTTDPGTEPDKQDVDKPSTPDQPTDPTTGSGTTTDGKLKYTYNVTENGNVATITFNVTNAGDFVGLVDPWQRDLTTGLMEKPQGKSATYEYAQGKTFQFGCKWAYAGGASETGTLSYTMGTATGINSVKAAKTNDATWYDISGRKVSNNLKPAPGLYIHNGKKVVVK